MDKHQLTQWEAASEASEFKPLTADFPKDAPIGHVFLDGDRQWQLISLQAGNHGARWAYWRDWTDPNTHQRGIGPHPEFHAVADRIFNGEAPHFIGLLHEPYYGREVRPSWVLVSPRLEGAALVEAVKANSPYVPPQEERYERSKEVYDVETREIKEIR